MTCRHHAGPALADHVRPGRRGLGECAVPYRGHRLSGADLIPARSPGRHRRSRDIGDAAPHGPRRAGQRTGRAVWRSSA